MPSTLGITASSIPSSVLVTSLVIAGGGGGGIRAGGGVGAGGYLAQDINFKSMLDDRAQKDHVNLIATHSGHLPFSSSASFSPDIEYRISGQPSLDGNTVDSHVEKSHFVENTMKMQATHAFLSGKIRSLMLAIRGD